MKNLSDLTLNSYKVDTITLQNSIKELNSMKEELQTTISHYRLNETTYIEQNQRLKEEIQMLHRRTKESPTDHKGCHQTIARLEKQAKEFKREATKYQEMYEVQKKNHQQVIEYYEKKLQKWREDHNLLINKYENHIVNITTEIQQLKTASFVSKSKKSIRRQSMEEHWSQGENQQKLNKIPSINKPPIPYQKNNTIRLQQQPNQEVFQALVRKIFYTIRQMGITFEQAQMLPQIKKMKGLKVPSKKQIANFLRNPPIEERDKNRIEKSINYFEIICERKYEKNSGQAIIDLIFNKIEEYQMAQKMNSEEIIISGMTPSIRRAQSYGVIDENEQKQSQIIGKSLGVRHNPNTLRIQSQSSILR